MSSKNILLANCLYCVGFFRIAGVMGYYGITYSTTNLVGNFYINYELSMQVSQNC